ncbi:MAG: hypothetical protein HYT37_02640 [Candidatus Sungbacteria bacterium]|nr:hypothetical protein [Candidatus Sungbacteria bacterium]
MNPKQFLTLGGIVLALVGILGMIGILGPTADQSIFGSSWWFDAGENWAHLVLGIVALIAAFAFGSGFQSIIAMLVGVVGIIIGLLGFFLGSDTMFNFYGLANLENPLDNILHLAVGAWALIAWWKVKSGGM